MGIRAPQLRAQATLPAEDGFVLIEVLVSALVLAIVAGAVLTLLQRDRPAPPPRSATAPRPTRSPRKTRRGCARCGISDLNRLNQNRDRHPRRHHLHGQLDRRLRQRHDPTSSCTSGASSADYVKITSTVTWPSIGRRPPVAIQSIVSPSNGSLDPNHGTLTVSATNAAGDADPGDRPHRHRRRHLQRHHRLHRLRDVPRPAGRQLHADALGRRRRPGRQGRQGAGADHRRGRRRRHQLARRCSTTVPGSIPKSSSKPERRRQHRSPPAPTRSSSSTPG